MDIYSEHLIKIRKNNKMIGIFIAVWAVVIAISVSSFLLLNYIFAAVITAIGVIGAWRTTKLLDVEYEYIVTNGEMDIDIITGKTDRKRLITFNCKDIERVEVYTPGCAMYEKNDYDKKSTYCNAEDENVYCILFKHKIGKVCLVMQIPKKMREAMIPFMDKLVVREAFG